MEKTVILKSKFILWYSKNEIGVPCNKMTYFTMKHEEKQLKKNNNDKQMKLHEGEKKLVKNVL